MSNIKGQEKIVDADQADLFFTITNALGLEVGININGVVAYVDGDHFIANHVTLDDGENTIVADAVVSDGSTAQDSVFVYADTSGDYIRLTADEESGISPLETTLRVEGSFDFQNPEITYTGPGTVEFLTNENENEYTVSMTTAGLYVFTAGVGNGEMYYTDSVAILVMDEAILILSFHSFVFAYNGEVHGRLNEESVLQSNIRGILLDNLGIQPDPNKPDILDKIIAKRTIKQWIAFGGEAEDYGYWPKSSKDNTRAFNHFHDPLEDWDEAYLKHPLISLYFINYLRDPVSTILWGFEPGRQDFLLNFTGDWSWGKAKENYYIYLTGKNFEEDIIADTKEERNSHFADCFRALGQVMHLLQDMSVPLHTRNDVHIFPLFGFGQWTYETYIKDHLLDEAGTHKLDFTPDQQGDRPDPHFFEVPAIVQDPVYNSAQKWGHEPG